LEVLEFAGVPWYFDEVGQCYRVRPDYRFPTLMLTDEEILGQALATAATKSPGLDVGPGASPTTNKLAAVSKEKVQQMLADATPPRIQLSPSKLSVGLSELTRVISAI
jgi:predicted DNA-binding transcriptional regulator YafY